ncbi:Uncharacterised protein [Citrobacter koseri]|uniref:Uncharacterized protein n=1 Tax=Citrobacter koseri TaxID=545 RepID=A0A2X2UYP3_CITKO|nr:Uncharacterised protein [Citrobacter koseri]
MLRRLIQLYTGLALYGVSTAMFVRADLGADPWNVFHLGVANLLSMNIGMVIIAVGVLGVITVDSAAPTTGSWYHQQRDRYWAGGGCCAGRTARF